MGLEVKRLTGGLREEWNAFAAAEPCFGLLQAWEWGEFKESLGWQAHRIALTKKGTIKAGAQLLTKKLLFGAGGVAYVPRGPIGDWRDPETASLLFEEMHGLAERNRCLFLKIEPGGPPFSDKDLSRLLPGFRPSRRTVQPQSTLIVDLDRDLDAIERSFRRKTRKYIMRTVQEGVRVRKGGAADLPCCYRLLRETSRRAGFPVRGRAYYENEWRILSRSNLAVLLMAYRHERLLAVRTVYRFGRHAAEFHAGSVTPLPQLHPNHLLVWEAIKWAKEQGCRSYDLWGIPDEAGRMAAEGRDIPLGSRTDGLWGVYRFKSGFSHHVVGFPGAYDYAYRPYWHSLISGRLMGWRMFGRIKAFLDSRGHPG